MRLGSHIFCKSVDIVCTSSLKMYIISTLKPFAKVKSNTCASLGTVSIDHCDHTSQFLYMSETGLDIETI